MNEKKQAMLIAALLATAGFQAVDAIKTARRERKTREMITVEHLINLEAIKRAQEKIVKDIRAGKFDGKFSELQEATATQIAFEKIALKYEM